MHSSTAISAEPAGRELNVEPEHYLYERYARRRARGAALRAYYAARPLLPRRVQLALRRAYAPAQARRAFPAWPAEDVLVRDQHERFRARLRETGEDAVPFVNFWPGRHRFAFVITHDVEGTAGVGRIPELLDVERRHGVVSSWNFCAAWYPIRDGTFERIRAAGGEIGLHGIRHDGKLFSSRAAFEAELPKIHHYLERWRAVGFRSPAMHRNADWMHELGCLYDSSFPDTDPFEPQPGGCCSIFPFFFGELVELPVTLVQDHTLFEVLRRPSIHLWRDKSDWIAQRHGLVNVIVHPDYLDRPGRVGMYDELLAHLTSMSGGWHALPREVATWWKRRATTAVRMDAGRPVVAAPDDGGPSPTVAWAREVDGEIEFSA